MHVHGEAELSGKGFNLTMTSVRHQKECDYTQTLLQGEDVGVIQV